MRHKNIISQWPSVSQLARDIGENPAAVYKWSERDSIPPRAWRAVIAAAEKHGIVVTTDDLLDGTCEQIA